MKGEGKVGEVDAGVVEDCGSCSADSERPLLESGGGGGGRDLPLPPLLLEDLIHEEGAVDLCVKGLGAFEPALGPHRLIGATCDGKGISFQSRKRWCNWKQRSKGD